MHRSRRCPPFVIRTALALFLAACAAARGADIDPSQAMGFEVEGAWQTLPDMLSEFDISELRIKTLAAYNELAYGLKPSQEHVQAGQHSGRWADHPRFPTIHSTHVPSDWSSAKGITFWAYSELATNELISLAVLSDGSQTRWKDYFLYTFAVDWTGGKTFAIPLSDFKAYEKPAGWGKVDAVYFFTKIFNRQPNPYTVLYLDDMRLLPDAPPATPNKPAPPARPGRLKLTTIKPEFDPSTLNHSYPETAGGKPVPAPITYGFYFKAERARHAYYPRFQPGFVSFRPDGKAYLCYGSYVIQTLDDNGRWTARNLLDDVIEPYARKQLGFGALQINNSGASNEATVQFDTDGDAYMMCFISDPTSDWHSRKAILLHSRDGLKTWDVHLLPYYLGRFAKFVGHNPQAFDGPPIILMSEYLSPTKDFFTIPHKAADGRLVIPPLTKIAEQAIALIPHSGEATQAIAHERKIYFVYGQLKILPGKTKEDGVPCYAVVYDRDTRKFSEPVLMGFGGRNAEDGHNWPAIAADSKGYLHVICNGHNGKFTYVCSKRPWDISEWTEPVKVANGTTYGGLICGPDDTLYTVTRCSHPCYYFRLSLHRKRPGQPWEEPKHLVMPFKPYYKVYYHKLVIDPATGRLFLAYHSQSRSICVFRDEYLAYLYTWPDREREFLAGNRQPPIGSTGTQKRKYEFYTAPPSETSILVSDSHGENWHLATTDDFKFPYKP